MTSIGVPMTQSVLIAHVQMKQKALDQEKGALLWGPDPATLPVYTREQVAAQAAGDGRKWVMLDGFVLDLEPFEDEHPGACPALTPLVLPRGSVLRTSRGVADVDMDAGGKSVLSAAYGKDVSAMFRGEVYRHTNAAYNLQSMYRVGKLAPQ